MRLRTIMTIVFCISAIAPLAIFWLWPQSKALDYELKSTQNKHMFIAENLSTSLDLYYSSLTGTIQHIAAQKPTENNKTYFSSLLEQNNVNFLCVVNPENGIVLQSTNTQAGNCPEQFDGEELNWMKSQVETTDAPLVMSGVMNSPTNGNVLFGIIKQEENIAIASIDTAYFKAAGSKIKFGNNGYAVIVDQFGKALFHPNSELQNKRTDLKDLGFDLDMNTTKNGFGTFYSSLLQQEMVIGYSKSKISGWSVIIPQPMAELYSKTNELKETALFVMTIGFFIAIILAYFASKILTHPIEQMVISMRRIGNGELRAHEKMTAGKFQPKEFSDARESIKTMAEKLQENIDTISRHAYLDGVTGLPNRECFRVLAQEEIDKLSISGNSGALLFLDLDGFKQVNDVYGHRAGDDLLLAFSHRLHEYCGIFMKRYARGVENALTVLPARLGGDEFVVFLGNISGPETTAEFANQLFTRVFGHFKLHNGVNLDISGSVGGAIFPTQAGDFDELLRLADIAMYEAKNNGKGRYCLHRDVNDYFEGIHDEDQFEIV